MSNLANQSLETRVLQTVDVAALLLAASTSNGCAALVASVAVDMLVGSACVVYRFDPDRQEAAWKAIGFAGEVSLGQSVLSSHNRLFAPLIAEPQYSITHSGAALQREEFAHLQVTRSIASISYLPFAAEDRLIGALEVISFSNALSSVDLEAFDPLLRLTPPALLRTEQFEQEKENLLDGVHRLTQLYDLEKSLNTTLDLDHVMTLIPRKVLPMLQCQAVHLWLFDGDVLTLKASSGADETVYVGMTQAPGEGYVADMAEEGETLLIADPGDERLRMRNEETASSIWTAMLVPLMQDEAEVGVLEAVNKMRDTPGEPFDEDDEFFLCSIAETASSALKNASLMFAERKLAILEALVHVSSEITSTLRLDRLLRIIVNSPQSVLPFERCAIALDNRGKLQLKAISGMTHITLGDVEVELLVDLVHWLATQPDVLHLRQTGDSAGNDLPEPVARHFEATGNRALYALPLTDDQGRVGVLLYESNDPDFLDVPHTEMIKILAGQATVAIRNALLYREVPLISLLEPLIQQKQALLRTTRGRRIGLTVAAVVVTLFLVFCPLPMRITGEATVAPQHLVTIAAPADGIVAAVFAREGERVTAGQVLASMNDLQWRMDLASADARSRSAQLVMQADLARGAAQAGADRAQVEYLRAEADRARNRIESATLHSPITGIVMTPALQNAAGEHLEAGAAFAQVLDLSSAVIDIAILQRDATLLDAGQPAAIKLDSYPQRSWHGTVMVVSPEAQAGDGVRMFAARVPLPNNDALLRSGMTGRAKVFIGYRPAGYVLLRRPTLWVWQMIWNWFGW
jgi:RND family efflux transporter MFP subunit